MCTVDCPGRPVAPLSPDQLTADDYLKLDCCVRLLPTIRSCGCATPIVDTPTP